MHKEGKWAKQILALQEPDGKWGCFHSLSQVYDSSITTEQALRRLERLGYTMDDPCIQKAVAYMTDCLIGRKSIPDPMEKIHDWTIFTQLMLATWIRRFTMDNPHANQIAHKWAQIIQSAFANGSYQHDAYVAAYLSTWNIKPCGGRLIDFTSFYPLSLLRDCLDQLTQAALVNYVLHKEDGIYYVYDKKLANLPDSFQSKESSRYLGAIELLTAYTSAKDQLGFVAHWLLEQQLPNGQWDMGSGVNDRIYFPLSDSWRKPQTRAADCTERINALLHTLKT